MAARLFDQNNELRPHIAAPLDASLSPSSQREGMR
jgi:hypothetical protein